MSGKRNERGRQAEKIGGFHAWKNLGLNQNSDEGQRLFKRAYGSGRAEFAAASGARAVVGPDFGFAVATATATLAVSNHDIAPHPNLDRVA
jgi:hypothetical protein